jgi:hypothetical protein
MTSRKMRPREMNQLAELVWWRSAPARLKTGSHYPRNKSATEVGTRPKRLSSRRRAQAVKAAISARSNTR